MRLREIDGMKNLPYLEKLHLKFQEIEKMKEKSPEDTTNDFLKTTGSLSQEKPPLIFNLIDEQTLKKIFQDFSPNRWAMNN